jgi:iron complex outermembrane receptor protein
MDNQYNQSPISARFVRVFLFLTALLLFPLQDAVAQDATVQGTITTRQTGEPLLGVSVGIEGTTLGDATDADGRFTIENVPVGTHTLVASSVGYTIEQKEIQVTRGGATEVDFLLDESVTRMDEVEVVGQRQRVASATKTLTQLRDLPVAIQIVSQETLQEQAVVDLKGALRNVSGVTHTGSYNGGYDYFNIRGFSLSNVGNYRRNGVEIWHLGYPYADNIKQVEIIKGPASVLFGDLQPGGIVNITTEKPLSEPYQSAELMVGEYGLVRPSIDVSGPITSDKSVLYRLNASYEHSNSFRDQVNSETFFVAPALTVDLGERTSWDVEASYKKDERVGDPGIVSPDGSYERVQEVPYNRFLGEPTGTYEYEDRQVFSTLEHRFGGDWRVRHTGNVAVSSRTPRNIYLNGVTDDGQVTRRQYFFAQDNRSYFTALDLIGRFSTGSMEHEFLAGVDYYGRFTDVPYQTSRGIDSTLSLQDPEYDQADLLVMAPTDSPTQVNSKRAIYAQDQVRLFDDRVHVLLGARYNFIVQDSKYDDPSDRPEDEEAFKQRALSPRLGLVYKPVDWLSLYGSYSEAFQVNGFDWKDPTQTVPPTYGKQIEAGLKGDVLDERLSMTLTAYQLRKTDVYGWAWENPDDPAAANWAWYTYQGGLHQSRGLELDVTGQVLSNLEVTGAAMVANGEVVEDEAYESGNALAEFPSFSGNVWATYEMESLLDGLFVGGGAFYRDGYYGSLANDESSYTPSHFTVDVVAGYRTGRYRAQLNVRNLTNEREYLYDSGGVWEPQWPRRITATVSATF